MTADRLKQCPYCGRPIDGIRPYEMMVPPDQQPDPRHTIAVVEETDTIGDRDQESFETVRCVRLQPCEHVFRRDDFEAHEAGSITKYELGDRVQNPATQ